MVKWVIVLKNKSNLCFIDSLGIGVKQLERAELFSSKKEAQKEIQLHGIPGIERVVKVNVRPAVTEKRTLVLSRKERTLVFPKKG